MICGFLGCDLRPFNPVLEALPRVLYLRGTPGAKADGRLLQLVDLALGKSQERQSGARCVLLHLSELLFVEVVRRYLDSLTREHTGWLAGLRDPITGRALALLHDSTIGRLVARTARQSSWRVAIVPRRTLH